MSQLRCLTVGLTRGQEALLGSPDPALGLRTYYADDPGAARVLLGTEYVDVAVLWIGDGVDLSIIEDIAQEHPDVAIVAALRRRAWDEACEAVRRGAHALLLRPVRSQVLWSEARAAATRHRARQARCRFGAAGEGPAPGGGDGSGALRRANEHLLGALVYASEIREATVPGHAERVARYALAVAAGLGWDAGALRDLDVAARLHDVGKIGVRAADGARAAGDDGDDGGCHAVMGGEILSAAHFPRRVVESVLHHHERFDGYGYPYGLAGADIPVGARVIAVADAAEVITTGRAYRGALDWEACLVELRARRGSHFDPAIVDAFGDVMREQHAVAVSA